MKVHCEDDDAFSIAVSERDGVIVIDFGTAVAWVGFNHKEAFALGLELLRRSVAELSDEDWAAFKRDG